MNAKPAKPAALRARLAPYSPYCNDRSSRIFSAVITVLTLAFTFTWYSLQAGGGTYATILTNCNLQEVHAINLGAAYSRGVWSCEQLAWASAMPFFPLAFLAALAAAGWAWLVARTWRGQISDQKSDRNFKKSWALLALMAALLMLGVLYMTGLYGDWQACLGIRDFFLELMY